MSPDRFEVAGFSHPNQHQIVNGRRSTMVAQLITTVSLVLSIVVTATVVSIGIARADALGSIAAKSHD